MGKASVRLAFASAVAACCAAFSTVANSLPGMALTPGSSPFRHGAFFEENRGQAPASTRYRARFAGLQAAIQDDGSLLIAPMGSPPDATVRMFAAGANAPRAIEARDASEFRTNYIHGADPSKHVMDVPHFRSVALRSVYPGIDLVYHAREGALEFDFEVAAGADPGAIALTAERATLRIESGGDLVIDNGRARVHQRRPVAYQMVDGARVAVDCAYRRLDKHTVALALGDYDATRELVIDPVVDYSSYLGGGSSDQATGVRVGPDGFIYVVGTTGSANFPVVAALDATLGGSSDAFVAKINPATGKAVYATYIGGGNADSGLALAVDASGNVYLTGIPGARFPTTTGAYQTSASGTYGYVAKLNAAGNALLYSTLVAGARPKAIEVDAQGRAVLTGSAGTSFVTTAGAYQPGFNGTTGFVDTASQGDAFALMLNATGSGAVFATFFGASGNDEARGVAIDSSGRIVIGGVTDSGALPMVGASQPALAGSQDAFIAMLSANGSSLVSSTYYGGTDHDEINGLALDPYGNVVVAGSTWSDSLPTPNAYLPVGQLAVWYVNAFTGAPAYRKGFVAKFAQAPYALRWATYLAARVNCCDKADAVAVDAAGDVYVSGSSLVDSINGFQQVNPFLSNGSVRNRYGTSNEEAIFVAGYSRDGQQLRFQSYMAPCAVDSSCVATTLHARASGQAVLGGGTYADWLPVTAHNTQAANASPNSATDAFVMTIALEPPPLVVATNAFSPTPNAPVTLVATSYTAGSTGTVTFFDGATALGTATMSEGMAQLSVTLPAGVRRITASLGSTTSPAVLLPVSVNNGSCP